MLFQIYLQQIKIRNLSGSKNAEYVGERSDIMRKLSLRQICAKYYAKYVRNDIYFHM